MSLPRKLVFSLLFLCAAAAGARDTAELPDDFHDAQDRVKLYYAYAQFKMGRYEMARLMWENITGTGRGEASFNLGILYELGKGVESSLPLATDHYRLAAQLGSRAGAYQMGLMHFTEPDLVSRDEATKWLAAAALEGDEDAQRLLVTMQEERPDPLTEVRVALAGKQFAQAQALLEALADDPAYRDQALARLGWMHEIGMGVDVDLERAADYFSEAAELGNAEAMYAIAVMYLTGTGKPLDREEGEAWLRRSAAGGYPRAAARLDEMREE